MRKYKKWLIKCCVCGKFIKHEDLYNNKIIVRFTPRPEFTSSTDFIHEKCSSKMKKLLINY